MVHKSFTAIRWFYTCNNHNWRTFYFCLLNFGHILHAIRSPISKINTGNIHKIERRSKRYKERRVSLIIEGERTGSTNRVVVTRFCRKWVRKMMNSDARPRPLSLAARGGACGAKETPIFFYCFYRKIVNNFLGILGPVRYFSETWNYF